MAARSQGLGYWIAESRQGKSTFLPSSLFIETGGIGSVTGTITDDFAAFIDGLTGTATQLLSASRSVPVGTFWVNEIAYFSVDYGAWHYQSNAVVVTRGTITDDFGGNFVDAVTAAQVLTKGIEIFDGPSLAYPNDIGEFVVTITADVTPSPEKIFTFVGG